MISLMEITQEEPNECMYTIKLSRDPKKVTEKYIFPIFAIHIFSIVALWLKADTGHDKIAILVTVLLSQIFFISEVEKLTNNNI